MGHSPRKGPQTILFIVPWQDRQLPTPLPCACNFPILYLSKLQYHIPNQPHLRVQFDFQPFGLSTMCLQLGNTQRGTE